MTQQSFLSEILARIAGAGRSRTQAVEDTAASLISLCHSLARFKQSKCIEFVEALPRNAMGKVQKNALREAYDGVFQ